MILMAQWVKKSELLFSGQASIAAVTTAIPTDRLCVLFGSCGIAPAEGTGVRQRLQKKAPEVGQ